jgi:hypothetical protein
MVEPMFVTTSRRNAAGSFRGQSRQTVASARLEDPWRWQAAATQNGCEADEEELPTDEDGL